MTAALEGVEWSAARPGPYFTPGKDPVPIVQEAGWAPGPVCMRTGGGFCKIDQTSNYGKRQKSHISCDNGGIRGY